MSLQGVRRVGVLTNIATPYRRPLFRLLAAHPGISLDVAYNAHTEANRRWQPARDTGYRSSVLPGRTLRIRGRDLTSFHLNWGIRRWLETGFDAVIVGGYASLAQQMAIPLCRRNGIPVILWSGSTAGEPSVARSATRPAIRALVRACDGYIAYGTAAAEYLETLGADGSRITIAANTVDISAWDSETSSTSESAEVREELGLAGRVVVLYAGQLIHRKGVDLLIDAFAQLQATRPDTALLVAGSGVLDSTLRAQARARGLEAVHFLGNVSYDRLPGYYRAADAVVLPSRSEVWGLTLNEAMASSRPVIATTVVGACRDLIVEGSTGWIAETGSRDSLAQCLQRVAAASKTERAAMGARARLRILQGFTLAHTVSGFVTAVDAVVSGTQARSIAS